jgi:hypothetical protein
MHTDRQETLKNPVTYLSHCCTLLVVEEGNEIVSRMRDDGTEDSSNVACQKADPQLCLLGALAFWYRNHVLVQGLHGTLKAGKLHHCVCRRAPKKLESQYCFQASTQPCGRHNGSEDPFIRRLADKGICARGSIPGLLIAFQTSHP